MFVLCAVYCQRTYITIDTSARLPSLSMKIVTVPSDSLKTLDDWLTVMVVRLGVVAEIYNQIIITFFFTATAQVSLHNLF